MTTPWLTPSVGALGCRRVGALKAATARGRATNFSSALGWNAYGNVFLFRRYKHPIATSYANNSSTASRLYFSMSNVHQCRPTFRSGVLQPASIAARRCNAVHAGQLPAGSAGSEKIRVVRFLGVGHNVRQTQIFSGVPSRLSTAARQRFSSNSDTSSHNPDKPIDIEPVMVGTVEAEVAAVTEKKPDESPGVLAPEQPRHSHIYMPSITDDDKDGTLTSWTVGVGDAVEAGDVVCEIELEQFSVGVKVETSGFLAKILVEAGSGKIPVGSPIATVVHSREDIEVYQKAQEAPEPDKPEEKEVQELSFSWKDVLKTVSRLSKEDHFSEDDASMLMSLARQKDDDLLQAFAGCFEGPAYTGELDDELFLVQARDIARTRRKREEAHEQKEADT